jgi:hypothetical protein
MAKVILFSFFFVTYLIINIYENYFRERWKYSDNYKFYSKKWHSIQFMRWGLVISFIIYLMFQLKGFIYLLLLSSLWKIFFDGGLNLLRGRSFFYQSQHKDLSVLEKYSTPLNKILFLIFAIVLTILIEIYL